MRLVDVCAFADVSFKPAARSIIIMASRRDKNAVLTKEKMESVVIDKWDGNAIKNALDDAVKMILTTEYGYDENHMLMDGRLAICSLGVGLALLAVVWDYLYPFPQSKPVMFICIISYFVLMGVVTLYTTFLEKGIFLVAVEKDQTGIDPDNTWTCNSMLKRFDDVYNLTIQFQDGKTKRSRESTLKKSIACWFDENGHFLLDLFEPDVNKLFNSLKQDRKEK